MVVTDRLLDVRTTTELDAMREAGRVVAAILAAVRDAAKPGARLRDLDELAMTVLTDAGATSSFLGYDPDWADRPFNGVVCLSPNETVVHGRPTGRRLAEGDLLSVDAGAIVDGWNGDAAITVHVGAPQPGDVELRDATEEALTAGIDAAVPGATLLDVATAVDTVARRHGYAHLPHHGGHGIGRSMHEAPFVPNEPTDDAGLYRLQPGNTIAIEPMLLAGGASYRTAKDGWSILTQDRRRAAHEEHTILVGDDGPERLTVL